MLNGVHILVFFNTESLNERATLFKRLVTIAHIKCLGGRGFHDLFNYYLCFFLKHNENCNT